MKKRLLILVAITIAMPIFAQWGGVKVRGRSTESNLVFFSKGGQLVDLGVTYDELKALLDGTPVTPSGGALVTADGFSFYTADGFGFVTAD